MTKRLFILSAVIIAFISIFVCPSSLAGTDDPTTGDEEESPATQDTTQSIPEMVDLGLSVKWASFNLGASSPEESGLFYQWGDIIGYGSDLTDGKHFYLDDNKWGIGSGKYDVSEHGYFIKHSTLALEDDAARVALGGKWRIPTDDEWDELWECSWELTTLNGVEGFKFYSQKEGYTDNWIFFPAVSSRYDGRLIKNRYEFWSSSLYIHDSGKAFCMHFNEYEEEDGVQTIDRCFGLPIRPVYGDPYIRGVFLDQSCIILTVGKETALSAIVKPSIAPN